MMPRRVRNALFIAFLCHGLFILTARYRLSYDAFTHMLFAEHYAGQWFSLWETRWYAGFTVVSYPPLTHQLIALFVPLLGFEKAYALILWLVTTLYPLGVYAFGRIFVGRVAASYAALASAILLPIFVTAHIFGQLPFLASTLLALFSAVSLNRYLREGGLHNFLLTVSLYTTTMALHHATLLVQPFLILAVITKNLFPQGDTKAQRSDFLRVSAPPWLIPRLIFVILITSTTSLFVIWPFWEWGTHQVMQTPIDHLSRHNFLTDRLALAIFFFPLYGPLLFCIPFLFRKWHPRFIGLLLSFVLLLLLGLGGTTPLPRLLFGSSWEWLTCDRFAFWAALTLTPFFGMLFIGLRKKLRFTSRPRPGALRKGFIPTITFSLFAATSLGAWFTPYFFPVQPDPIDMQPMVNFLNAADRSEYRYLTFGFGDQFAYLNLLTEATTIDGSYHTARTLPELRESGIGQIDTVYWALKGIPAIEPILKKSGDYGVRWGFVNPDLLSAVPVRWGFVHRSPFVPSLERLGWVRIKTLSNGILVYENPQAVLPAPTQAPEAAPFTAFSWGMLPILSLITTLSLGALRVYPVAAERVIRSIYSAAIALLPVSLCFWLYRTIGEFPHERVYFTYTHALFFLSDALVLVAVILWLSVKIARISNPRITLHAQRLSILSLLPLPAQRQATGQFIFHPSFLILSLFLLFLLASFSLLWSRDWRISLYISLHYWLIFLLILSLRDWHQAWKFAAFGFCAALGIEIITGFISFASQSTSFLSSLDMQWPGILDPSIRGASVVQLTDGLRVMRAYGTLPHPNILGGFALLSLLGPVSLFLAGKKPNYPALILFTLGVILIFLTFSRSAWLGLLAWMGILVLKSKRLNRKRLFLLLGTGLLTISLAVYPLRELVSTRVGGTPVATEQLSIFGREWLSQQAVGMFMTHPLTGVGTGSFLIELSTYAVQGAVIEPVHNLFLLAGSELGVLGALLLIGLFFSVAVNILKSKSLSTILGGATVAALGVIALFDHYLWSIAPGRIMLGLALGLWLGQVNHDA